MKKLLVSALIGLTLFSAFSSPVEAKSKAKKETRIEETQKKKAEKKEAELTPEKKMKKLSKKICGKKNYRNSEVFHSTDSSVCDGMVSVDSDFHDNLTNSWINDGECENAFEIAKAVFTDDTFKDINEVRYCVYAKYTDKFGNESEHIGIKIFITRDTFNKFNLEADDADLLYLNLPDVADYYATDFK